jgi:hypothetical protein
MKKNTLNKIFNHPSKQFHFYVGKKVVKFVLLHLFFVVFFAILYWISDIILSKFPDFSKKYLGLVEGDFGNRGEDSQDLFYYFWFSAVTQTTVGYGGLIDKKGKAIQLIKSDYLWRFFNLSQLLSVFLTPVIVLYWKPEDEKFFFF